MPFYSLNLSVQSSQRQHVVAAEPGEDDVYCGLEALQAALRCAAGRRAGRTLPGSALLLPALRAQPQALQHCWVEQHTCSPDTHTTTVCLSLYLTGVVVCLYSAVMVTDVAVDCSVFFFFRDVKIKTATST